MRTTSSDRRATSSATGSAASAPTAGHRAALALALALCACERSPSATSSAAPDARARSIAAQGLEGAPADAVIVLRVDGSALRASTLAPVIASSPALGSLGEECRALAAQTDSAVLAINESQQRSWVLRGAIAERANDRCAQRISRDLALPYERAQGALWFAADERRGALRSAAQGALVRSAEVREAMTLAANATIALVIDGARAPFAASDPRWAQLGLDPVAIHARWSAVRTASLTLTLRGDRAALHAEITAADERQVDALRALFEPMRPRLAAALQSLDTEPARALAPRIASNLHWIDTARSMRATLALDAASTLALARIATAF